MYAASPFDLMVITAPDACSASNQCIVDVNPVFCRVTGHHEAQVRGQPLHSLLAGALAVFCPADVTAQRRTLVQLRQSLKRGAPRRTEIFSRAQHGELQWFELDLFALPGADDGVRRWAWLARDITQRKAQEQRLQQLAFDDPLTGLPNRQGVMMRLEKLLLSARRRGQPESFQGSLMFIDLDNFKALNDAYGHAAGDAILQQVGQRLVACLPAGTVVARFGGDEFVAVLQGGAAPPAEAVVSALRQPYPLAGWPGYAVSSASIGITLFNDAQASAQELLRQADVAMYQAKAAGCNRARYFSPPLPLRAPPPPVGDVTLV